MVKNSHNYPNSLIEKLRLNWFDLFQKSTLDFYLGNRTFITLIEGYSNKQRTYHNIYHIYSILILLEQVKDYSKDIDILKFSAWFHDYVYDPKVTDNETKSAIYAAKTLKDLNINVQTIKAVTQIVLSTKTHKPLLEGIDNLIFLDADLVV